MLRPNNKQSKGSQKSPWLTIAAIGGLIVALAVILFFLLGIRVHASERFGPKAETSEDLLLLIQDSFANREISIEALGQVGEDVGEAVIRLSDPENFFVIVNEEGSESLHTITSLIEIGLISDTEADALLNAFSDSLSSEIEMDWELYEFQTAEHVSVVAIDSEENQISGIFPSFSRQIALPRPNSRYFVDQCSHGLPLTYYFWGSVAESISVCIESECENKTPSTCEVFDTPTSTGWFAEIGVDPKPAFDGEVRGIMCHARVHVDVKYLVGNVKLRILEAALGRSFSRSLEATLDCTGQFKAGFVR